MNRKSHLVRGWIVSAVLAGTICVQSPPLSAQVGPLNGTFIIQGQKGAITLTLEQDAEGNAGGTLKGGDLALVLKGFPGQGGAVVGTATTENGEFASYFQATRQGDTVLFDLIQANADGEPDMAQARRITFKAAAAGQTPTRNAAPNAGTPPTLKQPARSQTGIFSGKWQGEGLTLDSRPQGGDYTGTLTLNAQKLPFTATAVNNVLQGTFQSSGDRFDFQARLQNGVLVLESSGTTYRLRKPTDSAAKNPLAKPKPKTTNPLARKTPPRKTAPRRSATPVASPVAFRPTGAPVGGGAWKSFQHPVGLSLRYPAKWNATEANGALRLIPNDVRDIAGGPAELFLVTAQSAGGIPSAEDPRLETAVNGIVAQSFPTFQRSGETKQINAGNQPGIQMEWEGDAQGHPARLQVMTTILKNFAVSILAISIKSEIKTSRDATIRQVFASLVAGAGARDRAVVGKWFLYSYKGSGSYGRESKSYMTLLPNGTALWGNQTESSWTGSGRNSLGEQTWSAGTAGQGQSSDRGTWSAGQGQLIIAWGDGTTATWRYQVGGSTGVNRRLFLSGGNGKTDEWMETQ